jgi:hypothetical protein
MSTSVDTAFIELYEAEVKAAYQREGSLLRGTVRTRNQAGAERIYFPKIGKGRATSKARHADVTPMDLEHTRVFADMENYYAPEYIDDLDQAKTNWTLRSEYARASAWALGRQTDQVIIDAIDQTTNTYSAAAHPSSGGELTLGVINTISERLNDRDVPQDRMRMAVISPNTLSELLEIEGATSSDFVREQLLTTGQKPAFWMGFNYIVHTGLPDGVKGYFYHMPAVGHGICKDITTAIDRVPEKVAWLVNSWMSMGAVIIDGDGVEKLTA